MTFEIAPKETEIEANWYEAKMYCFSLNIDGKIGWRLPTNDELNEIFQSANDFRGFWYWSSTEYNGKNVWVQTFNNGFQSLLGKYDNVSYVRPIRDLS
jgi:hypothetical protein